MFEIIEVSFLIYQYLDMTFEFFLFFTVVLTIEILIV